jgi:hypothetical protein
MWGALSDERTSLSFTIAAGPRQRNHSRVRVPRDSRPYFTLSDSRLPQPVGAGPRIYIPQEPGGPIIPHALGSPFVATYDSQGYGGGFRNPPHQSQCQSYFTTGCLPAISSSWRQVPWDPRPVFFSTEHLVLESLCNILLDDMMGLSLKIASGPRQRSHSRIGVPRNTWIYFTVSDLRLPQPEGPRPPIYIPQEQGGPVIPKVLGSLFVASYDSQLPSNGCCAVTCLHNCYLAMGLHTIMYLFLISDSCYISSHFHSSWFDQC